MRCMYISLGPHSTRTPPYQRSPHFPRPPRSDIQPNMGSSEERRTLRLVVGHHQGETHLVWLPIRALSCAKPTALLKLFFFSTIYLNSTLGRTGVCPRDDLVNLCHQSDKRRFRPVTKIVEPFGVDPQPCCSDTDALHNREFFFFCWPAFNGKEKKC